MYPAIKSYAISEAEARRQAGNKAVDDVLAINCDFTGRVIAECFGVTEMSASVDIIDQDGDERVLSVLYLIDTESLTDCDDLGNLDYSDYTFTID